MQGAGPEQNRAPLCEAFSSAAAAAQYPRAFPLFAPSVAQGVSPLHLPQIFPSRAGLRSDPLSDRDPNLVLVSLFSFCFVLCLLSPSPAPNLYLFSLLFPRCPCFLASRPVTQAAAPSRTQGTDPAPEPRFLLYFIVFKFISHLSISDCLSPRFQSRASFPCFITFISHLCISDPFPPSVPSYLPGAQTQGGDLHLVAELHAGDGHGAVCLSVCPSVRLSAIRSGAAPTPPPPSPPFTVDAHGDARGHGKDAEWI